MKSVLIAIGGNALFDAENGNNLDPTRLETVCDEIAQVVSMGYQPIVTFGNGPQVGNLLEMAETYATPPKWPIPLDVCVAWTQAEIGYSLTKTLMNHLAARKLSMPILAVNTTVCVSAQDPAFLNATKFVGNFYDEAAAQKLEETSGWEMKADSNRGYRRVVASPKPLRILEADAIRNLVASGALLLCGGGGGIPVIEEDGQIRGVEAVIDKDYTACLLAEVLGIDAVIICTGIDRVYLNYGTPEQEALSVLDTVTARQYLAEGHFPPGSMGPKVDAMVHFVESGGEKAIITRLGQLCAALAGENGTTFCPPSSAGRIQATA